MNDIWQEHHLISRTQIIGTDGYQHDANTMLVWLEQSGHPFQYLQSYYAYLDFLQRGMYATSSIIGKLRMMQNRMAGILVEIPQIESVPAEARISAVSEVVQLQHLIAETLRTYADNSKLILDRSGAVDPFALKHCSHGQPEMARIITMTMLTTGSKPSEIRDVTWDGPGSVEDLIYPIRFPLRDGYRTGYVPANLFTDLKKAFPRQIHNRIFFGDFTREPLALHDISQKIRRVGRRCNMSLTSRIIRRTTVHLLASHGVCDEAIYDYLHGNPIEHESDLAIRAAIKKLFFPNL